MDDKRLTTSKRARLDPVAYAELLRQGGGGTPNAALRRLLGLPPWTVKKGERPKKKK